MQSIVGQIEILELFEVNERARFDAFNVARTQIEYTKRAKAFESVLPDVSQSIVTQNEHAEPAQGDERVRLNTVD